MKKHSNNYRIYEISQDLIDFLRGDGLYKNRSIYEVDKQIYSHYGQQKQHSDKYIGIIIELEKQLYFAPLSHDGDHKWFNREDVYDFEVIYDSFDKYVGSLLLCKALPLTENLVKYLSLKHIEQKEGTKYADLCRDELDYLNSKNIHDKIQDKMQKCIYGYETSCKNLRVDYQLVSKNVKIYNEMLLKIKIEKETRYRVESLIHQMETSMNDEKAKDIPTEQKEN